jgi:membrane-bound metal-dependent hydrolase YbcI (DUF457 family)
MTWITHTTFAYLTSSLLGFNPYIASIFSTAPDWAEDIFGIKEHRGITHYVLIWGFLFLLSLILFFFKVPFSKEFVSLSYGGFSHIFLDALTKTGVPVVKDRKIKIGGIITTGKLSEWVFLALVFIFFTPLHLGDVKIGFSKWKTYYEKGIIDKREYLERRFKLWE